MQKTINPLVSVLILNWNRLEDTKRSIKSVLNQSYKNIEIIVLDNASTEEDTDSLKILFPEIQYYKMDRNYGCPGGRNRGIDYCRGEFIFFVDNDGILQEDAICNAVKIFLEKKDVAIVTGRIILFKDVSDIDYGILLNNNGYYDFLFNGGISMHRRSIYEKIGKFNEDFMYGAEETNMCYRLLTIGMYVYFADNVVLWHKESPLARNQSMNMVTRYANKLVTYWELLPISQVLMLSVWFIFNYTYHCFRSGCGLLFVKNIPGSFIRAIEARKKSKIRVTNNDLKRLKLMLK